jgi:prephenate dehydrogenase
MKICILGTGHMGTWLTEELCHDHDVAVYDRDSRKLKYFIKVTRCTELAEIGDFAPELLINCVSLEHTKEAFDTVLPHLPADCTLCDIASVKEGLPEYYRKTGHPFLSTHPMFGPTLANFRDLSQESAIIITESDEKGKEFFRNFYRSVKAKTFEYSFDEHDRTVAYSLSTPFASTLVFAACMKKQEAPGTNFKKHMKIAEGLLAEDDYLLSEILFSPYTLDQIEKISQKLSYLSHIIRAKDYDEMILFLNKLRSNIGQ